MEIITVFLNNTNREAQIKRGQGFVKLRLTAAEIFFCPKFFQNQTIELILLNDSTKFTAFSNLLPDSKKFNCFDLLEAAYGNQTLKTENFHTLKCILQKQAINEPLEIKLTFDIK